MGRLFGLFGLSPAHLAAYVLAFTNGCGAAVIAIGRARAKSRDQDLARKIEGLKPQIELSLANLLARNNLDLMDRFNGRYLQTVKFEAAHRELMEEIQKQTGRIK
jgi:hypothetical protein